MVELVYSVFKLFKAGKNVHFAAPFKKAKKPDENKSQWWGWHIVTCHNPCLVVAVDLSTLWHFLRWHLILPLSFDSHECLFSNRKASETKDLKNSMFMLLPNPFP